MKPTELKQRIDLADYVRSCGIDLKPHGKNDFVGRCPFHDDDTPSFVITPAKQLWHCLGCNKGGSVVDFVMERHGVDLKQAMVLLTEQLPSGKKQPKNENDQQSRKQEACSLSPERSAQLLEKVIAFYEKTFADIPEGRQYLEGRGISDAGLFAAHRIGYCNGTLTDILPESGEIWSELKELGILLDNRRERFTGCVVVPVLDIDGNIITLYGRHTDPDRKQHMFLPGRSKGLWNVAAVKTYPEIVLTESVIDGLSLQMAGHQNVVAINGNVGFTNGEVDLFGEHGVQSVTFLLDGDDAGRDAAARLSDRLNGRFRLKSFALPDDHDPNSFLVDHGPEKLAEFIARTTALEVRDTKPDAQGNTEVHGQSAIAPQKSKMDQPLADGGFAVTYGIRRYEIHGLEKGARKLKATVRIEHAGKLHVDTLDFYSARARRGLCQDICRIFEQSAETIESDINKLLLSCENHNPDAVRTATTPDPVTEMSAKERNEAEAFGKRPDLIEHILADYEKCGLVGERHNKLLCYLAAVSRKMDEPLSVLILSSSGAGKTALQDATLAFCPPEDVVKLTSLSGKALFYKDEFSLKHKILALEEGDGAEAASYAIRNLISAGVLIIESTIKDLLTGRMTTMENRVEGPTVVFLTTTDPNTDSETKSRFWITSVDESRDQTRAIQDFQRRLQSLDGLAGNAEKDVVVRTHQNFQRLLKPLAVVNPYAELLDYSDDRLQGRRDQPKYLNLIRTVAFLRQMTKAEKTLHRNGKTIAYIQVDLDDIRVANDLTHAILGKSLDELSAPARELLIELDELVESRFRELQDIDSENVPSRNRIHFTRRDVRDYTGWSRTRVHTYLNELIAMEYVVLESGKVNCLQHYRLLYEGQGNDGGKFMPGLKSIDEIARQYEAQWRSADSK